MKRASLGTYLALGAASMVLAAACSSSGGTSATTAPSAAAPSTAASEAAPSTSASGGSTGEAVKIAFIAGQIGITCYTGGKHTFQSQYVGVNTKAGTVILASDNMYLYENLEKHVPIAQTLDADSNLRA